MLIINTRAGNIIINYDDLPDLKIMTAKNNITCKIEEDILLFSYEYINFWGQFDKIKVNNVTLNKDNYNELLDGIFII